MDYFDDSSDDSGSVLSQLLNTAATVGTTALVANSSQPLVVQTPAGVISNSPNSIAAVGSSMSGIFIFAIVALAAIVLVKLIR